MPRNCSRINHELKNHRIMKRHLSIAFAFLISFSTAFAQPSWVKKASRSVFTLKTFAVDGSLIASSNGFFTGPHGEAVSNFAPFKGAARAVIIDAQGKELEVVSILGANDVYDVVKFRVDADKTVPLIVSAAASPIGSATWLLPYHEVKSLKSGPIRKAELFQGDYTYYTVAMPMGENQVGCPLLNGVGEVIGMMQQPASAKDTLSFAVSARYADSLKITAFGFNDPVLKQTRIRKALPSSLQDAVLSLYLAGSQMDSISYVALINDFIRQFPSAPEGYVYHAQQESAAGNFPTAERDMEQAIRVAEKKDDAHYNYARLIYNKEVYQSDRPYANWSLDRALAEAQEANRINPQPAYQQLEANILYAQKKYREACNIFTTLAKANNSAESWFSASSCQQQLNDTTARLALLDSAMNTFSKPYLKEVAPYLWARAQARRDVGRFRESVNDMNDYEELMKANVNDNFYYIRHQTEIQGRLYQQALNDIDRAIQMNPKEILYYAEKASLEVRVGLLDRAMATAQECIGLDASNSDGYLFLGLAQCLKGQKKEGLMNLQKAKELGDGQAEALIEKYR